MKLGSNIFPTHCTQPHSHTLTHRCICANAYRNFKRAQKCKEFKWLVLAVSPVKKRDPIVFFNSTEISYLSKSSCCKKRIKKVQFEPETYQIKEPATWYFLQVTAKRLYITMLLTSSWHLSDIISRSLLANTAFKCLSLTSSCDPGITSRGLVYSCNKTYLHHPSNTSIMVIPEWSNWGSLDPTRERRMNAVNYSLFLTLSLQSHNRRFNGLPLCMMALF